VRDEHGDVALAVVVFRDVTELRRLERQRDEYLALVSHDLRNPLSAVKMSVTRLKTALSGSGRTDGIDAMNLVKRANRNVDRMVVMLQELTEATRFEAQGMRLCRVTCDMRQLVDDVIDSIDDTQARRISIDSIEPSFCMVLADIPRLERVVTNLLTNALKYSADEDPVIVRLGRTEDTIELDVIDRGIGIAPEDANRLFERYYRTTASRTHADGLGLGLYIAQMIVHMHGGRIDVVSEVGKGSVFKLTLPAHAEAADSPPPPA
jgi:signal transduction histidine kinase